MARELSAPASDASASGALLPEKGNYRWSSWHSTTVDRARRALSQTVAGFSKFNAAGLCGPIEARLLQA